jgi:hypothetical protein
MRLKAQGHDFHFVTGNEEDDDAVSAWDRIQDRCRCLEHDLADLRVAAEKAEAEAEQVEAERPGIELAAVLMRAEAAARKRAEQERVAELARQKVEEAAQRTKVVEKLERQPSEPHVPRLRDANDVARIEEARKLYARGNISKTAAVKEVLAPGSTGRIPKDLMTHINRLRKKI